MCKKKRTFGSDPGPKNLKENGIKVLTKLKKPWYNKMLLCPMATKTHSLLVTVVYHRRVEDARDNEKK